MKNSMHILAILVHDFSNEGLGFNTNFLEANVINIFLLISGLIYVLRKFLGANLIIRQKKVLSAIQESEERLKKASLRLKESEKQLAQTQIIINQIEDEARVTAIKVKESILLQGSIDIKRLTESSKISISNTEAQAIQQIQQQITNLAIRRVMLEFKNTMTPEMQSKIIDNNISQLGGEI